MYKPNLETVSRIAENNPRHHQKIDKVSPQEIKVSSQKVGAGVSRNGIPTYVAPNY
jgi:hypothetical protein